MRGVAIAAAQFIYTACHRLQSFALFKPLILIESTFKFNLCFFLKVKHVNTQSLSETFVCRWIGCKVFDRASCSRSWLERHVLSHGGNKPFRCIVDGCGQRFSSQVTYINLLNTGI